MPCRAGQAARVTDTPSSPAGGPAAGTRGRLVLLCGRSFSGKSRAASVLQQGLPAQVVSLDALNAQRGLHGGQGISVQEWAHTNEQAKGHVRMALVAGGTVVVDDTASPRFLRDEWRALADQACSGFVLVFLDTPAETIRARLLRNRDRPDRDDVIDAVMDEHLASFEEPGPDEDALVIDSETLTPPDLTATVAAALEAREQASLARATRCPRKGAPLR